MLQRGYHARQGAIDRAAKMRDAAPMSDALGLIAQKSVSRTSDTHFKFWL